MVFYPASNRNAACGGPRAGARLKPGRSRDAPYGWRIWRQGVTVGDLRLYRLGRGLPIELPGQTAPRP